MRRGPLAEPAAPRFFLQRPKGRVVLVGGLHRSGCDAVPERPADEAGEDVRVGVEDGRVGGRRGAAEFAEADAGGDLHLVDVEACGGWKLEASSPSLPRFGENADRKSKEEDRGRQL